MHFIEWPLIGFTLLVQLGIGILLSAMLIRILDPKQDRKLYLSAGYWATGFTLVGMLLSFTHLGTPLKAYNALSHVGGSWLSNEVFVCSIFLALLILFVAMERFQWGTERLRDAMGMVAVFVGLVETYAMSKLYVSSIIPAWNSSYTFVQFYSTMLVLGTIFMMFLNRKNTEEKSNRYLYGLAFLAVLLEVAFLPGYLSGLNTGNAAAQASASLMHEQSIFLVIRWLLIMLGIFVVNLQKFKAKPSLMVGVVLSVFVGELIGRYVFYATAFPINIGM